MASSCKKLPLACACLVCPCPHVTTIDRLNGFSRNLVSCNGFSRNLVLCTCDEIYRQFPVFIEVTPVTDSLYIPAILRAKVTVGEFSGHSQRSEVEFCQTPLICYPVRASVSELGYISGSHDGWHEDGCLLRRCAI